MKSRFLVLIAVVSLVLVGCSTAAPAATGPAPSTAGGSPSSPSKVTPDQVRTDAQGAVTVDITPLNLKNAASTFDFSVSMNTHSVDLSMDMAPLATLSTNTGVTTTAVKWNAPGSGGHHVTGTLSFPTTVNGKPFLLNATQLTLTLRTLDVPERNFQWDISP